MKQCFAAVKEGNKNKVFKEAAVTHTMTGWIEKFKRNNSKYLVPSHVSVSYTHLDVYKRQMLYFPF